MANKEFVEPAFEQVVVEHVESGYWVGTCDVNGDGRPDLVASGCVDHAALVWYENPGWQKRHIATLEKPVSWEHADLDGDGRLDAIVCHNFGDCPRACQPQHGRISWLRNPGTEREGENWDVHTIDDLMGTHRIRLGHFTQSERLELLGIPVVGPGDVHNKIPLTLYTPPSDGDLQRPWPKTVVSDSDFSVVHDAIVGKFGGEQSPGLDSLLVCSAQGLTLFSYRDDGWQKVLIDDGHAELIAGVFAGTGNVAVARIGGDPYACMMTLEPFHGNDLGLLVRTGGTNLADGVWEKRVLDVYGEPNRLGEGTGHHVIAADFDGDGDDEFLVGFRGPPPHQGVWYYKAVDLASGTFVKRQLSTASTSIIAVADFDGDGRLDFATIGYFTPGFFLADDPSLYVFYNRMNGAGRPG